jgi:hypothetical protein
MNFRVSPQHMERFQKDFGVIACQFRSSVLKTIFQLINIEDKNQIFSIVSKGKKKPRECQALSDPRLLEFYVINLVEIK